MSSIKPGSRVHPKALSDISLKWSKEAETREPKATTLGLQRALHIVHNSAFPALLTTAEKQWLRR